MTDREKLRRLAEHPSTPEPERQAARRALERLGPVPDVFSRSFAGVTDRASSREVPFGDPVEEEAPQDRVFVELYDTRTVFLDRLEERDDE